MLSVDRHPTEAQKEAGNYRKGHLRVHGMEFTVETPKGAERRGVDARTGEPWSVKSPAHYGYLRRTEGADGGHVDAYLGPDPEAKSVYIVDQKDLHTGRFDEHKVMLDYPSEAKAVEAYVRGFSDGKGRERIGAVTSKLIGDFKHWLKHGDTKAPASYALRKRLAMGGSAALANTPYFPGASPGSAPQPVAPPPGFTLVGPNEAPQRGTVALPSAGSGPAPTRGPAPPPGFALVSPSAGTPAPHPGGGALAPSGTDDLGLVGNLAAGAVKGIAGTAGALWGGITGENAPNVAHVLEHPLGPHHVDVSPQPNIAERGVLTGANALGITTPEPQTEAETLEQGAGSMLPFAVGGEGSLLGRLGSMAALGVGSTVGGQVGGNLGQEIAGPAGRQAGEFTGQIAGGGLTAGADAVIEGATDRLMDIAGGMGVGKKAGLTEPETVQPVTDAEGRALRPTDAQMRMAAGRIAKAAGQAPADVAQAIPENPSAVEGFRPTMGESTGNLGLLSLERQLRNQYRHMFIGRDAADTLAMHAKLDQITPDAAADAARNYVRAHLDALSTAEQAENARLTGEAEGTRNALTQQAQEATAGLGGAPGATSQSALGAEARARLEAIRAPVKAEAQRGLDAVDPTGSLALNAPGVAQTANVLLGSGDAAANPAAAKFALNPKVGESLAPAERGVLDAASNMAGTMKFADLRGLLSQIGQAMRQIRTDPGLGVESRPFARMVALRQSVENAMENGVATKAAEEATPATEESLSKPPTLEMLRDALERRGWRVDHMSTVDGRPSSYYLSPASELEGREIRISDHELGTKHGERQGARWPTNIVLNPDLSLADHLRAVDNEDYANGGGGFGEGYSYDEWRRDQENAAGTTARSEEISRDRPQPLAIPSRQEPVSAGGRSILAASRPAVTTQEPQNVVSEPVPAKIALAREADAWQAQRRANERAEALLRSGTGPDGARGAGQNAPGGQGGLSAAPGYQGAPGGGFRAAPNAQGLQGEPGAAALTPNFDEEAASRLRIANKAYADYKQRFRTGPVGDVLKSGNSPEGYRLGNSDVVSRLFAPGAKGGEAADALIRAAGSPEEAQKVLGDYPAYSLRKAAEKNGLLDLKAYERWLGQHKEVLDRFPALRAEFGAAAAKSGAVDEGMAKASQAIDEAAARSLAARKDAEDSAFRFYANSDPHTAVQKLLGAPDSVAEAKDLMNRLKASPEAQESVRRNLVDYLLTKVEGTAEAGTTGERVLSKKFLQTLLKDPKKAETVRAILGPARFNTLRDIGKAMDLTARAYNAVAIKGSPGTAADYYALMGHQQPSLLTQMLIGEAAGRVAASTMHIAEGAGHGWLGAVGGVMGAAVRMMRGHGIETVNQLTAQAVLNPELGRALLARAATSVRSPVLAELGRKLALIGAIKGTSRYH